MYYSTQPALILILVIASSKSAVISSSFHDGTRPRRHIFKNEYGQDHIYYPSSFWYNGEPESGPKICQRDRCIAREQCIVLRGYSEMTCIVQGVEGVCCRVKSCENYTTENSAIFTNPSYPEGEKHSMNCEIGMETKQTTCAVRVDFHETRLTPSLMLPSDTIPSCYEDLITILVRPSTGDYNTPFCGNLKGYSTLIEINSASEVKVIALTQSNGALWKIQLTQIECGDIKFPVGDACGYQIHRFQRTLNTSDKKQNKTMFLAKKTVYGKNVNGNIPTSMFPQSDSLHAKQAMNEHLFNGQEAVPHEFPWIAVLLLDSSLHCAASIITRNWLLTAGHCIELSSSEIPPIERLEVLLGAHGIAPDPNTITKSLSNIVRHPSLIGVNHDIALLKLFESISYSSIIGPICLPLSGSIFSPAQPVLAGWGLTASGQLSPALLKTSASLVSRAACQAAWRKRDTLIADYMICSTAQACNGDSGGPLMVQDENKVYYVIGIVSFGPKMCGDPTLPEVFVKVHMFLQWIAAVLTESK